MAIKWNNFKGLFGNPVKTVDREKEKHKRKVTGFVPTVLVVQRKTDGLGKERHYPKEKVKGKEKESESIKKVLQI